MVPALIFSKNRLRTSCAPADMGIGEEIRNFLEEEIESGFRRYIGMGRYLDDVYQSSMKPFIHSLP